MISTDDLLWYLDGALDAMVEIVEELGDDLACQRIDTPGANSPYAILTHCLGVITYWGGEVIAGHPVHRDRASEFVATGRVADLVTRVREVRDQLDVDLAAFDPLAPPRGQLDPDDSSTPRGATQGGVLLHVYEELAQHRGQLEVTRDVLLAHGEHLST